MARLFKYAVIAVLSLSVASYMTTEAYAKPDKEHGKGHGKAKGKEKSKGKGGKHHGDDDKIRISLDGDVRVRIEQLMGSHYRRHCPPGLAKKHNGCRPPGQAKKYVIGQPLPGYVDYWPVPRDVLDLLPIAPHGSRYVWVDRDVLLISEATKKVLDATVILSAL